METKDITNLPLSKHATDIANQMKESGLFEDALSAAKFGMAYAIKYCYEEIDTAEKVARLCDIYDSAGNNYNVGSVDPDHYIADLFLVMYPGCDTPYKFARVIMCRGLNELGDFLAAGKLFPISNYM
jgi:hypothetical protein